jgi:hypothetical protein
MIGRHYLIYSKKLVHIKRQYTICNSIVPKVYQSLLDLCQHKLDGKEEAFSGLSELNSADTNSIFVTLKDYKTVRGVASQLNDQELKTGDDWYVKGPIGMGIDVNTDGHNLIFAGGTGILVFLDIVAMMVI